MYTDDKLFAKNEKQLEIFIQEMRIYSQDLRMKFGIEKRVILIIRSGKQHMTERKELPNEEKIRTLGEKETYKYLRIVEKIGDKRKKLKMSISGKRESFSKPNDITGIS